jgi:zinc and cadmium transporter
VPQEIGDFAILLDSGYSRARALAANALSASSAVIGAAAGFFLLERLQPAVPHVMAFSAAGFLYIAVADLIPAMHKEPARRGALQVLLVLAGVATIALLEAAER